MDSFTLDLDALLAGADAEASPVPEAGPEPANPAAGECKAEEEEEDAWSADAPTRGFPSGAIGVASSASDDDEFDFGSRPIYRSISVATRTPATDIRLPASSVSAPSAYSRAVSAPVAAAPASALAPELPPVLPDIFPLEKTHTTICGGSPAKAASRIASVFASLPFTVDSVPCQHCPFKFKSVAVVDFESVTFVTRMFQRAGASEKAAPELVVEFQRRSGSRSAFTTFYNAAMTCLVADGVCNKPRGFVLRSKPAKCSMAPLDVPAHLVSSPVGANVGAVKAALRSGLVATQRDAAAAAARLSTSASAPELVDSLVDVVGTDAATVDPAVLTSAASALAAVACSGRCSESVPRPAAMCESLFAILGAAVVGAPSAPTTLHARREAARALASLSKNPDATLAGAVKEACTPTRIAAVKSACAEIKDTALLQDALTTLRCVRAA